MAKADHPAFQDSDVRPQCSDPTCPCQDGDACHYQGEDADRLRCPMCGGIANRRLYQVGLICPCGVSWVGTVGAGAIEALDIS